MIELDNVTKNFCGIIVLEDISLKITSGEFVVVLGAIGSGKSVLLRQISGLETPDNGKVKINAADISQIPQKERPIAFISKNSRLSNSSILRNLSYPQRIRKTEKYTILSNINRVFCELSLSFDLKRKIKTLNEIEKFNIMLARSATVYREILLIDFGGFDSLAIYSDIEICTALTNYRTAYPNQTIILATTNVRLAEKLNKRTIFLHNGKMLADGCFNHLLNTTDNPAFELYYLSA